MIRKKILLGVTGGISAYKVAELIRLLDKAGHDIRVIMTQSATAFITPLTLQTLSKHPVRTDLFALEDESQISHIELARWADLLLIAPASAHSIAKLAHGLADDLLSTVYLAAQCPVAIAPAMNQAMWAHPATQANITLLQSRENLIWGPAEGAQACGETGPGRLLEPEQLVQAIDAYFYQLPHSASSSSLPLKDLKVLITAGPTREPLDPIRYLSNHSSGKMGYAIAAAAIDAGASVTLVSGPVTLPPPAGVTTIQVQQAQEMYEQVMALSASHDIFIGTAAVADFHVKDINTQKIKKEPNQTSYHLELVPNPDILKSVGALPNKPYTVGFAAETEHLIDNATLKLQNKHADMICANLIGQSNPVFNADHNTVTVITRESTLDLPSLSKKDLAHTLIHLIAENYFHAKTTN